MRVLLLTLDSRGDVQPFVALAESLRASGHEVFIGAPGSGKEVAQTHGVSLDAELDDTLESKCTSGHCHLVHELGVAPEPLPQREITSENLVAAMHSAVTERNLRKNSGGLAERIRSEQGVANAADIIESFV